MPHQKSNKVVQSRSAFACVVLWIFCGWLILSNFIKFHALHRTVPLKGVRRNQRMQDNKPPKKQMKPYTKNKTLPKMIKWKMGVQHGTTLFVCQIPEYQVMFQDLSAPSLPQLLSQELSFICRLWLLRQEWHLLSSLHWNPNCFSFNPYNCLLCRSNEIFQVRSW